MQTQHMYTSGISANFSNHFWMTEMPLRRANNQGREEIICYFFFVFHSLFIASVNRNFSHSLSYGFTKEQAENIIWKKENQWTVKWTVCYQWVQSTNLWRTLFSGQVVRPKQPYTLIYIRMHCISLCTLLSVADLIFTWIILTFLLIND